MATILHVGPADHEGYQHFIVLEPINGTVRVDNGDQGVALVGGHPTSGPERQENHGEPGQTLHLCGQREFDVAGTVNAVTFPDGTVWTAEAS